MVQKPATMVRIIIELGLSKEVILAALGLGLELLFLYGATEVAWKFNAREESGTSGMVEILFLIFYCWKVEEFSSMHKWKGQVFLEIKVAVFACNTRGGRMTVKPIEKQTQTFL